MATGYCYLARGNTKLLVRSGASETLNHQSFDTTMYHWAFTREILFVCLFVFFFCFLLFFVVVFFFGGGGKHQRGRFISKLATFEISIF